jgi:hypothetical protein
VFKAVVILFEKTTRSGSDSPKNSATDVRTASTFFPAFMDSLCPDREGLAAVSRKKAAITSGTAVGFGHDVEALSR